jgi:membrane protease YdiL (CAAX protease family)
MIPTFISVLLGIAVGTVLSIILTGYILLKESYLKHPIFGILGMAIVFALMMVSFAAIDYVLLDLDLKNHDNRRIAIVSCYFIWGITILKFVARNANKKKH